jgi:hypothetical protein
MVHLRSLDAGSSSFLTGGKSSRWIFLVCTREMTSQIPSFPPFTHLSSNPLLSSCFSKSRWS